MLVLGIPGSAATAVILGALLLHDVQPGPQIFQTQPELVYTIIAALLVSVLLMFVLGLLTAGPMVRLLRVPEAYVAVLIVLFAYIGAFAIRNTLSRRVDHGRLRRRSGCCCSGPASRSRRWCSARSSDRWPSATSRRP